MKIPAKTLYEVANILEDSCACELSPKETLWLFELLQEFVDGVSPRDLSDYYCDSFRDEKFDREGA